MMEVLIKMARKRIPDEDLSEEQRKKREKNDRYRQNKQPLIHTGKVLKFKKTDLKSPKQTQMSSQTETQIKIEPQMETQTTNQENLNNKDILNNDPHKETLFPSITQSQTTPQIESQIGLQTMAQTQSQISNETQKMVSLKVSNPVSQISSRWESLFNLAAHPEYLLSIIPVIILSAYLTYQNYLFFEKIESSSFVAAINACISELVLIILAASIAFSSKKMHKFFLSLFLISTILGLGSFFHGAISDVLSEKSKEKEFITKAINVHLSSIEALPASYVSRRQELQKKIDDERAKLTKLDSTNDQATNSSISNTTSKISYAFWIRFVAMILNAYLVHCLFSRLKRTGCFDY